MKKFLIATVLGIATTAAFGAASLRAPQIGGTATVATPTATTNTARAGTMRTQTMKTSSVSTPSVTTTQSVATPVSTETTDARIALLKGIKGFNPGKIKDTTTATSELNSLNDRIEELTAQLDRAEAAQSSVITEANIDAKIDQKLSQIGTSTDTKKTYSKEEVDNLLTALEEKLPIIDDRGNITWNNQNAFLPYYLESSWWRHGDLEYTESYRLRTPGSVTEIPNEWLNTICAKSGPFPNNSIRCYRSGILKDNSTGHDILGFYISRDYAGFYLSDSQPINNGMRYHYFTHEQLSDTQLRSNFCNSMSNEICWISDRLDSYTGNTFWFTDFNVNIITNITKYYELIDTIIANGGIVTRYIFKTNATEEEIYEFVDNWCNGASAWCHTGYIDTNNPNYPNETLFTIAKRTVGHYIHQQNFVNYGGHMGFDITYHINVHDSVYNNDPVAYVQQEICNNNVGACYVTWVNDNYELYGLDTMNSNLYTFYDVGVFKEMLTKEELPAEYKPKQQTPDE